MTADNENPYQEADDEFSRKWADRVRVRLQLLLETKHLYQSTRISEPDDLAGAAVKGLPANEREDFSLELISWAKSRWSLMGPRNTSYLGRGGGVKPQASVSLPDIKIYCRRCKRKEALNPIYCQDCLYRDSRPNQHMEADAYQVFAASFLCQSCKLSPEVFVVSRVGLKLTLCGRTPIEHVAVSRAIPESISKWLSDATVAHQSGKTLAGLFLLRTMIEQWVRQQGHNQERVDDALEAYGRSLPEDFRSRFPSLGHVYSLLSGAIHSADPSE